MDCNCLTALVWEWTVKKKSLSWFQPLLLVVLCLVSSLFCEKFFALLLVQTSSVRCTLSLSLLKPLLWDVPCLCLGSNLFFEMFPVLVLIHTYSARSSMCLSCLKPLLLEVPCLCLHSNLFCEKFPVFVLAQTSSARSFLSLFWLKPLVRGFLSFWGVIDRSILHIFTY